MCACSGEKNTATTAGVTTKAPDGTTAITTTPTVTTLYPDDPEKLVIALPEMTKYSVVSTESKGAKLSKLVSDLARRVDTKYGITVNKLVDTASEPGKYEIIIGDTTREETQKAKELLGDNDYIITVIENKLVIYSKIDEAYSAITDIVIDFVQNDSFAISRDFSRIKKYKAGIIDCEHPYSYHQYETETSSAKTNTFHPRRSCFLHRNCAKCKTRKKLKKGVDKWGSGC